MSDRHLIVVGAGITGLAAALAAVDAGWQVTVLESADRCGGKIRSSDLAGHRIDEGADAFLIRSPSATNLCARIEITNLTNPATGAAMVWLADRLQRLPGGLVLGVPARFDELAESGILSEPGLRRAMAEPDLAGDPLVADESIGSVVRRRYGDEVADRLVHPLLGGIAAGDPDRMSIDACVPQLAAAARRGPSLSRSLEAPVSGATPEPVFAAPMSGVASIIDAAVEVLRSAGAAIHTGSPVESIERSAAGAVVHVGGGSARSIDADGVVVGSPAGPTARLLDGPCAPAAALLRQIDHASVAMLALVFQTAEVTLPAGISGFLVPRDAGLTLTAASFGSTKWPHWSDGASVVIRASAGHRDAPTVMHLTDDELLDLLLADLERTLGITAAPTATRISRWPEGFPQYDVGHLDRVAEIDELVRRDLPAVRLAGATYRGLGIPACIDQGRAAVASLEAASSKASSGQASSGQASSSKDGR